MCSRLNKDKSPFLDRRKNWNVVMHLAHFYNPFISVLTFINNHHSSQVILLKFIRSCLKRSLPKAFSDYLSGILHKHILLPLAISSLSISLYQFFSSFCFLVWIPSIFLHITPFLVWFTKYCTGFPKDVVSFRLHLAGINWIRWWIKILELDRWKYKKIQGYSHFLPFLPLFSPPMWFVFLNPPFL